MRITHKISAAAVWSLVVVGLVMFQGCFGRTSIPIPVLEYGHMDASEHENLLILLRGMGGKVEDFDEYGIIQSVRDRHLPFDIVAPDAHFGYYKSRTLDERLRHDIILPARRKGYRQIWLAGFSMGGLGSLLYLRQQQADVDGVILVSPFLGWEPFLSEIERDGGIHSWTPQPSTDQWEHIIWDWVKTYSRAPEQYPPVFLGYAEQDGISGKGPELLSTALPAGRYFSVPGRHDYKTFQLIWKTHLDRLEDRLKQLSPSTP